MRSEVLCVLWVVRDSVLAILASLTWIFRKTLEMIMFPFDELASQLRCKIGPWFKYLNVSNLWSAKYMVGMPWSDCFRRTMYKGLHCIFLKFPLCAVEHLPESHCSVRMTYRQSQPYLFGRLRFEQNYIIHKS